MALPKGMTQTKEKVSQKFDLEEIFGVDLSGRPDLKEEFGQAVIDKILERTESGLKRGGKGNLAAYSKSYKDSAQFEQFGKSSTVNMDLKGDMLDALDIVSSSGNEVEVGFNGTLQNAKAYGHLSGMKGHKVLAGKTPKRPFFGLTRNEVEEIKSQFVDELESQAPETDDEPINLEDIFRSVTTNQ